MKRVLSVFFLIVTIKSLSFAIDFDKAKQAIAEYSYINNTSYIPVLIDYGFTEQRIKTMQITNVYLGNYVQQLGTLLSGYGEPTPEITKTILRNTSLATREISQDDFSKIELFVDDMAGVARILRDEAIQQRTNGQNSQNLSVAEQERNRQLREQYQRIADEHTAQAQAAGQEWADQIRQSDEARNQQEAAEQERNVNQAQQTPSITVNTVVYLTRTGDKYHRDGCSYLSRSKIQTTLGAVSTRYEPCSRCRPPVLP